MKATIDDKSTMANKNTERENLLIKLFNCMMRRLIYMILNNKERWYNSDSIYTMKKSRSDQTRSFSL